MIYYRLLALTDLLFVGFVLRVVFGELKVLDEASPTLFLIFFVLISVLMLVMMFINKKEKTVTYKGKQITITNEDKMFIKLIRKSGYKVDEKLEKLVTNQGGKLAKLTSFIITIALFIRITQILNIKISLAQNVKLIILLVVMSVMFFLGLSTLFGTKVIQYNIILPYYRNLMLLETIEELDKDDGMGYINFLKRYRNIGFDENSVNKLREEIKEGKDRVSLLIDIDQNTNLLR
ncbi:hypothetical protein [Finegoldia magna]|uniref:Uncharacterized protein n=1 Tax=Finegoldia magna (strain ATCC 29328 / DSM 20472 / WAL 2508) TaxID=334413 RepID=B0S4I9_FINM2|nr:hypothetical protein [Finegoldia magna]UEA71139.1 hypothetical protein LK415_09430 [Finegoldia magna]BAG09180.1 hypothetical protein FMG_P0131 [Finegoldia magna ATCC 29328]